MFSRAFLERSTTILTNSQHRPWTLDGFGSSFNKAEIAAGYGRTTCTSTICAERQQPDSTLLAWQSE